jgi:hypothetical protein
LSCDKDGLASTVFKERDSFKSTGGKSQDNSAASVKKVFAPSPDREGGISDYVKSG